MVDRGNDHAHTSQCNARASGFSEWRFLYRHNDVFAPYVATYYSTLRTLSSKGPLLSQAVDTSERTRKRERRSKPMAKLKRYDRYRIDIISYL